MRIISLILLTSLYLTNPASAATLTNPLATTDINEVIGRLIQAVLGVTGSIALLMFVYGGFLWLSSAGNPKMVQKGKDVMIWAVAGIVIIVLAYAIISTIVTALEGGDITK
jgi:uncharacterized BrkB/YihY/UPF0761 family membrane protein